MGAPGYAIFPVSPSSSTRPSEYTSLGGPDRFAGRLLGAEVGGCAGGSAFIRRRAVAGDDGDAEIGELGPRAPVIVAVVHEQDVRGFDVPVHDSMVVDVGKPVRQVIADVGHVHRRERTLGAAMAQVLPANEFHHQIGERVVPVAEVRAGIEERHERVVAHSGQDADFLTLPAGLFKIVGVVAEELDRHVALEQFVVGPEHGGLAAPANEVRDPVPPAQQVAGFHALLRGGRRGTCRF